MSKGDTNQLDQEKGLLQTSNDNDSSSPTTNHKMKVDTEDSVSIVESPTPEKPESGRKGIVVSSLARNLLSERYKDRFAHHLGEDEDDTDDEDYNDILSPGGRQSLTSKSIELFEKHKDLLNLFNRMESSIRLLHLRKKKTTFKNISTQVEVLTKREFSYSHLAQMKHLFPEAIQIKQILLHDEKSLCMYADMEITLVIDAVECTTPDQSPSMAICESFYSKLLSYLEAHPEGSDIPEATLPKPFDSRSKEKLHVEAPPNGLAVEPPLESSTEDVFLNASHFPQSFQKLMCQKIIADGTEKTQLLSDLASAELNSVGSHDTEGPNQSPNRQDKCVPVLVKSEISATPNHHLISCCQESTPKQGALDSPLISDTPEMLTPKRPLPSSHDKLESDCGNISEQRSASSTRRTLMYSPLKFGGSPSHHDVITAKLEVAAKKDLFSEEASVFTSPLEENDPVCLPDKDKINQVDPEETQEKLSSLRATFDVVYNISRSTKNSIIRKQELFHSILTDNLEIEETGEIEEQMHILQDLAPHWISKKVHGGEILYSIEQIPDLNSIRAKLVESI